MVLFDFARKNKCTIFVDVDKVFGFVFDSSGSNKILDYAELKVGVPFGMPRYEQSLYFSISKLLRKLGHEDETLLILEPSFLDLEITHGKMDFDDSVEVTEELLAELVKTDNDAKGQSIITDRAIISTRLNGYHVSKPIGKKCKHIEIDCLATIGEKTFLRGLVKTVSDITDRKPRIISLETALAYVLRSRYADEIDHVSLVVGYADGGFITLKNGLYHEAVTLDLSSRVIRNFLSPYVQGNSADFIASHLSLYEKNLLDQDEIGITKTIIDRMVEDTLSGKIDSKIKFLLDEHKKSKIYVLAKQNERKFVQNYLVKLGFSNVQIINENIFVDDIVGLSGDLRLKISAMFAFSL